MWLLLVVGIFLLLSCQIGGELMNHESPVSKFFGVILAAFGPSIIVGFLVTVLIVQPRNEFFEAWLFVSGLICALFALILSSMQDK
jgi:hypothetical protein